MKKLGSVIAACAFFGLMILLATPQAHATGSYIELTPIIAQEDSGCSDANEDGECDSANQE